MCYNVIGDTMKRVIIIIFCFYLTFITINTIIFYNGYMARSRQVFGFLISETKTSPIINDTFGEVEEVKLDNFLNWYSHKKGYDCIKLKIKTSKGSYKVCREMQDYIYIVNNVVYKDIYSISSFKIQNDKSNDFYNEVKLFLSNSEDSEEQNKYARIKRIEDNTFEYRTNCEFRKENECVLKNKQYLGEIFDSLKEKYSFELIEEPKIVSDQQ